VGNPFLSIITIVLNDRIGLEKTILSVKNQTFRDFEHIVIDGGSEDGSKEVMSKYSSCLSLAISEKDTGIYNAMNKGISHASGYYCLFLNAGDYLASDVVLSEVFNLPQKSALLYGDVIFESGSEKTIYRQPEKVSLEYMMKASFSHPSTFIKRDLFANYGNYDESFKIASDYDFFLKILLKYNETITYLPMVISVFDLGGISNDPFYKKLQLEERERSLRSYLPHLAFEYFNEVQSQKAEFHYIMFEFSRKTPILWFFQKIILKICWWFFYKKEK
jgi:glycosyltransferase involved in cell wall biosynthesis